MSISLAFADNETVSRQAVAFTLRSTKAFTVPLQTDNGKQLINLLKAGAQPDICIVELKLPITDGIETLKEIRHLFPEQKILLYSRVFDEFNILRAYKYGANGVFHKNNSLDAFADALKIIYEEGMYIPNCLPTKVINSITKNKIVLPELTKKEQDFLRYYCAGYKYQDIAEKLNVAVKTLDRHRENIMQKFGVPSRMGLLMFALKTGIAGIESL
jgi:DNA-binding NarL/FixJ family response regulator